MNATFRTATIAALHQRGVGLVELMVSLLLGSMLVVGMVTAFQSSRQTFHMQEALAYTQESGTFAIDFLQRDLLRAGSGQNSDARNVAFDWDHTKDGGADKNDELAVVFDPATAGGVYCTGEGTGNATRASNHYWINDQHQLMCQGGAFNGASFVPVGTAQAMADDIDSFQVLYGVDTAHTGCPIGTGAEPTLYVPASLVDAAITRGETACPATKGQGAQKASTIVRTVRVALLVRTAQEAGDQSPATRTWQVLEQTVGAPTINPQDGHLRRLFTRTVQLRDMPEVFVP